MEGKPRDANGNLIDATSVSVKFKGHRKNIKQKEPTPNHVPTKTFVKEIYKGRK